VSSDTQWNIHWSLPPLFHRINQRSGPKQRPLFWNTSVSCDTIHVSCLGFRCCRQFSVLLLSPVSSSQSRQWCYKRSNDELAFQARWYLLNVHGAMAATKADFSDCSYTTAQEKLRQLAADLLDSRSRSDCLLGVCIWMIPRICWEWHNKTQLLLLLLHSKEFLVFCRCFG